MNDPQFGDDADGQLTSLTVAGDGTVYLSTLQNGVYVHDPDPSVIGVVQAPAIVRATAYDADGIGLMEVRGDGGAWQTMTLAGGVYSAAVSVTPARDSRPRTRSRSVQPTPTPRHGRRPWARRSRSACPKGPNAAGCMK